MAVVTLRSTRFTICAEMVFVKTSLSIAHSLGSVTFVNEINYSSSWCSTYLYDFPSSTEHKRRHFVFVSQWGKKTKTLKHFLRMSSFVSNARDWPAWAAWAVNEQRMNTDKMKLFSSKLINSPKLNPAHMRWIRCIHKVNITLQLACAKNDTNAQVNFNWVTCYSWVHFLKIIIM